MTLRRASHAPVPGRQTATLAPSSLLLLALLILPVLINPGLTLDTSEIYLNVKVLWTLAVILPAAVNLIWTSTRTLRGTQSPAQGREVQRNLTTPLLLYAG